MAMHRTLTIYVPDEMFDGIAWEANDRDVSMSVIVREALEKHLHLASPAEAARDAETVERDCPPSAPPVAASRVASAGESKHPWRRQGAALAKRPAAMRSRS